MNVYLITSGEYSDYQVQYVTLDEKLANKYVELMERTERYKSDCRVEVYDTDDFPKLSFAEMDKIAKKYIDAYEVIISVSEHRVVEVKRCHVKQEEINNIYQAYYNHNFKIIVEADNLEIAIKKAIDLWFKKKAEKEWIT